MIRCYGSVDLLKAARRSASGYRDGDDQGIAIPKFDLAPAPARP